MPELPSTATNCRVVITDATFGTFEIEEQILKPLGCALSFRQCKTAAELIDLTADADFVVTQFAAITANVIDAMRRARLIVRYGIGVDNVDVDAARRAGIPVCNVPDYCIAEVADHTLALALSATRRVTTHWDRVRSGGWGMTVPPDAMKTLAEMTVGVIGFGRIGRQVVQRLSAFGCRIRVSDPVVPAAQIRAGGAEPASLDDLWRESDLITLHCPSGPQTRRIVNADTLAKMKTGVVLVNVGRGDLVDSGDLLAALNSGKVSAAALDVWNPEPPGAESPLLKLDNVILTPHVASVSAKAVRTLRESVANTVARAVRGEPLVNVVNGVAKARAT
ncbi:MAG: C-terminal binding protein [Tepidisphaeraceae bacterium]